MVTPLHGDRPLERWDEDRLGFQPMARRLANALTDQAAADGLVVGVEGKWGSGKSSLVFLTLSALRDLPDHNRPEIIEFRPWLVGGRDALLDSLFADLVKAIENIEKLAGDTKGAHVNRAKSVAEQVKNFSARLGGLGKLTSAAGIVVPGLGVVGGFIEKVAEAAKEQHNTPTLSATKEKINALLSNLPRRIIVTIDDIDRLEPSEAIEILRLVRSVADFPNVVYVLCYDGEILSGNIESAVQVPDGDAFLEKIVQVAVSVPLPEPFDLRRWFSRDLSLFAAGATEQERQRLATVIDTEGGRRFNTPRSVVRTLNAIRFLWPALRDEIDLSDLVWLQLIKAGNPGLYRWIEEYCAGMAATSSYRARVSEGSLKEAFAQLEKHLKNDGQDFDDTKWTLSEYLPGIKTLNFPSDESPKIYEKIQREKRDNFIRDRRLASPDHYRLYFALALPANAPTQEDFDRVWSAVDESPEAVGQLILNWLDARQTNGATKAEIILDRLTAADRDSLSSERCGRLFRAFGDILDQAGQKTGFDEWGSPSTWRPVKRLLPILRQQMESDLRAEVTISVFGKGVALSWLTSIFRDEMFDHGRVGNRPREDRLLSPEELDQVTSVMIKRYQGMTFEQFIALPKMMSALHAWRQAGDENGPSNLLSPIIESDEGLITVLERMTGRVQTSESEYVTLSRANISDIVDYDRVYERTRSIGEISDNGILRERAKVLLRNFETGKHF
jgi:hypothetical protein